MVFLGDGATWIWDRVPDLANENSVQILDYYRGCEHLSDSCKVLYGEGTDQYWVRFNKWRNLVDEGKVEDVIDEFKQIRDDSRKKSLGDLIQKEINYFEANKDRMKYDEYRKMKLPIGSGTIESACKNVIGGRLKQGGMTWSESGAEGMLQIRSSIKKWKILYRFFQDSSKCSIIFCLPTF